MKKIYFTLVVVLIAAASITFGAMKWNEKVETVSESAKEKIETVKKTDPDLAGDLPTSNDSDDNTEVNETEKDFGDSKSGQGVSGNSGAENNNSVDPSSPGAEPSQPEAGLEEIKAAYLDLFSELEVLENSKIDQIVVQAKADHVSGKYTKEDLLIKYQEIALSLEAQADQSFAAVYQQLEYDLKKNGHDVNEAVIYRNEYERKKDERLSQVINKLSQF